MTISIPQSLKDKYSDIMNNVFLADDFFSRLCTIYYPPTKEACTNCEHAWLGGVSTNVYQHGGPAPINNNGCDNCGGNGYKEVVTTDTIRLRIYWAKKDWIKQGTIVFPDADAQVIGKIADLAKLLQSAEIGLVSQQKELEIRMRLAGEPFFHGFGKNEFFVAYLKRT